MSDQFDWRTDDVVWVDEPVMEPERGTAVSLRTSWFFAIASPIFLIIIVRVTI